MTVHVYLGPSLAAESARRLLPHAVVHPPVAAGDLLRLDAGAGDVVALIDGYFLQERSVRHREIRHLLELGVTVWGASSMGALRAAEMSAIGMRGHGWVYAQLASGCLEGDDEVAVLHGPAERGYPVLAEALVTVRRTADAAVETGSISPGQAAELVAAAGRLPFVERSWPRMAAEAGLDPARLVAHRVDVKALDAVSLLQLLARGGHAATPPSHQARDLLTAQWLREAPAADGVSVMDCLTVCRLLGREYPELQRQVLARGLARLAAEAGCTPTPGDPEGLDALARRIGLGPVGSGPWEQRWLRVDETRLGADEQRRRVLGRLTTLNPGVRPLHWIEAALRHSRALERARPLAASARRLNAEVAESRPGFRVARLSRRSVAALFAERWEVDTLDDLAAMDRGFSDADELSRAGRWLYLFTRETNPEALALGPPDEELRGSAQRERRAAAQRVAAEPPPP